MNTQRPLNSQENSWSVIDIVPAASTQNAKLRSLVRPAEGGSGSYSILLHRASDLTYFARLDATQLGAPLAIRKLYTIKVANVFTAGVSYMYDVCLTHRRRVPTIMCSTFCCSSLTPCTLTSCPPKSLDGTPNTTRPSSLKRPYTCSNSFNCGVSLRKSVSTNVVYSSANRN